MLKRFLVALCLIAHYPLAFADTCPSIKDIKHNKIIGWKAFDSDDDKPLSAQREKTFKQSAIQFVLAEWSDNKLGKNTIHCFYRDKSGSNLDAYLAKSHFAPKQNTNDFWYQVSGHMHCAAGAQQCEFENYLLHKKHFAKK